MTENKALKRKVRARMQKTGERYTAARRHLVARPAPEPAPPVIADPGMSDETIRRGSGKGWDEWLAILDAWGATDRTHTEIARQVREEHGVDGWWAQSVTVGYERMRGMRARHQRPTGFTVTVSKTFHVSVDELFSAFTDAGRRSRWLERGTLRSRTAQPGRSARFDFQGGPSRAHVYFEARGDSKARVTVEHERLPDADAVEELRAFWRERLSRLAAVLRS